MTPTIIGQRAAMLLEAKSLEKKLNFQIPHFVIIPCNQLPQNTYDKERLVSNLVERKSLLNIALDLRPEIFVRPSPIDELKYKHLSFAGVYSSYAPQTTLGQKEHLMKGLTEVLLGRFTAYTNYYYHRHRLSSGRKVAVIVMEMVKDIALHGTAYVYKNSIITEFLNDNPLSIQSRNSTVLFISDQKKQPAVHASQADTLRDIRKHFKTDLDIEYVIDKKGTVYIVEIRPISYSHLKNWRKLKSLPYASDSLSSAILNTPGKIHGKIIDLRSRNPQPKDFLNSRSIFLIKHQADSKTGTSSFKFLEWLDHHELSHILVIVDHGRMRRRDHLQYILVEDPGIDFIIQTLQSQTLNKLSDGKNCRIISDGLRWDCL